MCVGGYGYSQPSIINNDSILQNYIKNSSAYDVFYYYENMSLKKRVNVHFDFKEAYYNEKLKFYLLKLLDENEYLEYQLEKYKIEQKKKLSKDSVLYDEAEARYWLGQYLQKQESEHIISIDSILASPNLYNNYINLTLEWILREKREKTAKAMLPDEVLFFHSQIAYPEFYNKMQEWIIEYNIDIMTGSFINHTYTYLLYLNEPKALEKFSEVVDTFIRSKGKKYIPAQILGLLENMRSPFAIEQLVKLTNERFNIVLMSDNESISIESYTLYILATMWDSENKNLVDNIDYSNLFKDSAFLKKHKKEIIRKAFILKQRYKEEQEYWMENMPFNNNK